jgi:hypothetical protein
MATESEVKSIMLLLNEAYPDSKYTLNDTLIKAWVQILGRYELTTLQAATLKLIAESSFVPKVADIVKQIKSLVSLGQPTAAEAWGIVAQSLREYGYYEQQKGRECLPPMIRKVVDEIGYRRLCECDEPEIIRAQFMRMYDQEFEREQQVLMLPQGVGEVVAQIAEKVDASLIAGTARRQLRGGPAQSIGKLLSGERVRAEVGKCVSDSAK